MQITETRPIDWDDDRGWYVLGDWQAPPTAEMIAVVQEGDDGGDDWIIAYRGGKVVQAVVSVTCPYCDGEMPCHESACITCEHAERDADR